MAIDVAQLNPVCVGVDVGQIRDPTAIGVTEVLQVPTGKFRYGREFLKQAYVDEHMIFHKAVDADPVMTSRYAIRHIRRLPLGMSYPDVAMYIADMLCNTLFLHREVRVLIDVTGVGRPVYDLLKYEIRLREATQHILLKPITFTYGMTYNRSTGMLGKAFLVSRLQSLFQRDLVDGPDTPEMHATIGELLVYEIKVSDDGKDSYGAFKIGTHDDLATCLGLACLEDPWSERVRVGQRMY